MINHQNLNFRNNLKLWKLPYLLIEVEEEIPLVTPPNILDQDLEIKKNPIYGTLSEKAEGKNLIIKMYNEQKVWYHAMEL